MQDFAGLKLIDKLNWARSQKWFYEFTLPDGTKTESYLPENIRKIHTDRKNILCDYLSSFSGAYSKAIDVSCHEGFFSIVLAQYFDLVIGLDKNLDSLEKAKRITNLLGYRNIRFDGSSIEGWDEKEDADFILCFGLLYHVENPIQILRILSQITRKAICIETQVLPFEVSGKVEDGNYMSQRDIKGSFGICLDYPNSKEGGITDLALVPSRGAMEFLLKHLGFKKIDFYLPNSGDYEQFTRSNRVIILAEK